LYGSLAQRWVEVKYIPMRTGRADVEKGALGTLSLQP
jgi:penicillin amidase